MAFELNSGVRAAAPNGSELVPISQDTLARTMPLADIFYSRPAAGVASYADPFAFEDFGRSDRTLNGDVAPTGQIYNLQGPGGATAGIFGGVVFDPGKQNWYADLQMGAQILVKKHRVRFVPTGASAPTLRSRIAGMIVQSAAADLGNLQAHLTVGMDGWSCDTRRLGTWNLNVLAGARHHEPNVFYEYTIITIGTTLTIIDPDGVPHTATVAANAAFVGSCSTFQVFDGGVGAIYEYEAQIAPFTIGELVAGAAPGPNEAAVFRMGDFAQFQAGPSFTAVADTYHRILKEAVYPGGPGIICELIVSAQQANGLFESCRFGIQAVLGSKPEIRQLEGRRHVGAPLPAIRASHDGSALVGLDLSFSGAGSSSVLVRYWVKGVATPVAVPQAGAATLGSGNEKVWILQDVKLSQATFTLSVEGYHSLLVQESFAGLAVGTRFSAKAISAIAATFAEGRVKGKPSGDLAVDQNICINNVAPVITAFRVSRLSSGNQVRVDCYAYSLAPTYPVTLTLVADPAGIYTLGDGTYSPTALADGNAVHALTETI